MAKDFIRIEKMGALNSKNLGKMFYVMMAISYSVHATEWNDLSVLHQNEKNLDLQ